MNPQTSTMTIDINKDLGFGQRVAQESRQRLLNQDGSFNVVRRGVPFYRSLSIYHSGRKRDSLNFPHGIPKNLVPRVPPLLTGC
jgi:hypothetical protein